jgi:hypothetical protein
MQWAVLTASVVGASVDGEPLQQGNKLCLFIIYSRISN